MTHAGRPKLRICRPESIPRQPHCCVRPFTRPNPRPVSPFDPIQNISGVAQGPAVRSVIPSVRFAGTKRGKHAPMSDMRRRELLAALSGAAAAWPLVARAQQPTMPVVGFLRSAPLASVPHFIAAFREGLKEQGFVEGRSIAMEFRSAEDQRDRLPALVADLLARGVSLIACDNFAARAAKAATATVPIVFAGGGDPRQAALAASLNVPGGKVTASRFLT